MLGTASLVINIRVVSRNHHCCIPESRASQLKAQAKLKTLRLTIRNVFAMQRKLPWYHKYKKV